MEAALEACPAAVAVSHSPHAQVTAVFFFIGWPDAPPTAGDIEGDIDG